jgi:hypothetical protein
MINRQDNIADPAKFQGERAQAAQVLRGRRPTRRYRLLAAISVMSFFRMALPKVS